MPEQIGTGKATKEASTDQDETRNTAEGPGDTSDKQVTETTPEEASNPGANATSAVNMTLGPLSKLAIKTAAVTTKLRAPPTPVYPAGLHPLEGEDMRRKLVILDRSGAGGVSYIPLDLEKHTVEWNKIKVIKSERLQGLREYGAVVFENNLYVFGGMLAEQRIILAKVQKYDPVEDEWTNLKPMSTPRHRCCVAVSDRMIIVIGGEKGDGRATASCEAYDPETDTWKRSGMLPAPRKGHACVQAEKMLLSSGGVQGKTAHKNLWAFENHKWHEIDDHYPHELNKSMEQHCMVRVKNTVYFIGGISYHLIHSEKEDIPDRYTQHVEASVESFKPTVSVADKSQKDDLICPWSRKLPSLIHARTGAGVFALDNTIYVLGGEGSGSQGTIFEVESYNTEEPGWTVAHTLPKTNYRSVQCVLLDFPKHRKKIQLEEEVVEIAQTEPDVPLLDEINQSKWVFW